MAYTKRSGSFIETVESEKTQIYVDYNEQKICIRQCNFLREHEGEDIENYIEEEGLSIVGFNPSQIDLLIKALQEAKKEYFLLEEEIELHLNRLHDTSCS